MHKLNVIARRTVWIHIIILHRVRWYNFRYSSYYEGASEVRIRLNAPSLPVQDTHEHTGALELGVH